MLSLSPRADLFRLYIPKDYVPTEILEKYDTVLSRNAGVITNSIDYLNESIQSVTIPGIMDIINEQYQISRNTVTDREIPTLGGKINIEPHHPNYTYNSGNPLDKIKHELTITFRQNQGFINYFMLYEMILARYSKPWLYETTHDQFELYLLDELGSKVVKILFFQPKFTSLDDLEFSYAKMERQVDTFSATVNFNNVDIDFIYEH